MTNTLTRQPYLRTPPAPAVPHKRVIGFDTIEHIDADEDLGFQLRGHGYNPLADGAIPLFGLIVRLRKTQAYDNVGELYDSVRKQIAALDEEARQHGYDNATHLAYRYILCAFIDEAVMGTPWGSQSIWAERSMLSIYHDETWGGEKFFTILSRMLMEPEKYRDVLEFQYLCLCLGFKGKYGVQHNGNEVLQGHISKLHRVLRELRGDTPEQLTDASANVTTRRYLIGRQLPWWTPWLAVVVVLAGIFAFYAVNLDDATQQVMQSLDEILKH
ncbi:MULTISPECIES: type IVB secretion system protein IcmH/DotU [Pseudomonas]|uniref:type IVB secretion system protein IcmH/DotU n=1 Tax=Pseudomonas TaxID=286 RepID=UPI0018A8D08B|nr:type IVB secretion system protein IcmH/DotU [Pseudomonas fulva]MBF8677667.1 DotU family type IV/VI secretion system protein [Pseudomonas fulva]MBF8719805.1 DotU family type IV/VI secretion system protein [Pseudomonas fulva]MBF8786012.1 DotU family type IV/VI secretion system protein [Pseudomonas fulva]